MTIGRVRPALVLLILVVGLGAARCSRADMPDAYGNVEAIEVSVSAEAGGRLIAFDVTEGQALMPGASVGTIDPSDLQLQRNQVSAQHVASESRVDEVGRQRDVIEAQRAAAEAQVAAARAQRSALESQLEIARRNLDRTTRLVQQQAATAQQLDQAERDYRVLGEQIAALHAQRNSVTQDVAANDARVAQIAERIAKSRISAPFAGTVLATYARAGEFVQPGQPLFRLASLDTLTLRAYVTETQLAQLKLGQRVQVTVDRGEGVRSAIPGTVSWIASKAEFTPTPVQTRDERADLVYAVKILVPNRGGVLKIGMPADVALLTLART